MNKGKILLKFFPFEMEKWKVNARNWGQSTDTNILDTSAFNSSGVSPSVVSPRDDTPRWDIGRKTTNMRQIEGSEAGGDTSHWQISDMSKQSTPSHLTPHLGQSHRQDRTTLPHTEHVNCQNWWEYPPVITRNFNSLALALFVWENNPEEIRLELLIRETTFPKLSLLKFGINSLAVIRLKFPVYNPSCFS